MKNKILFLLLTISCSLITFASDTKKSCTERPAACGMCNVSDGDLIQARCKGFYHKNCVTLLDAIKDSKNCPHCGETIKCIGCDKVIELGQGHKYSNCDHYMHNNCLNNHRNGCPECTKTVPNQGGTANQYYQYNYANRRLFYVHVPQQNYGYGAAPNPYPNNNNNIIVQPSSRAQIFSEFLAAFSLGLFGKVIVEKKKDKPNHSYIGHWLGLITTGIGVNPILSALNPDRIDQLNAGKTVTAWLSGIVAGGIVAPYFFNKWADRLNQN